MQSVLYMWCGYLLNWKKYYFILEDSSILYCDKKGGQIQGRISLQLINIHVPIDNPVCFNIHTGIDIIYLKALSIQDKVRWVKKINHIIKTRQKTGLGKLKQQIVGYKNKKQQILKRFQQYIKQLWISHAKLQGAIQNLSEKHMKNNVISISSNNANIIDDVRRSAASYKFKATQISKFLEEIAKYLREENTKYNMNNMNTKYYADSILDDNDNNDQYNQNNQTQFLSFIKDQSPLKRLDSTHKNNFYNQKYTKKTIVHYNKQQQSASIKRPFKYNDNDLYLQRGFSTVSQYEITPIREIYISENIIKKNLIETNQVFRRIYSELNNKKQRDQLPQKFIPELKFPVLSTITGAIGQNFTKIAFPVTVNEPLSMLQKGCEQLYYSELLKLADQAKDPVQKMSYLVGFVVSTYSLNQGRVKKPFNPLLGQTFIYDDKQRQFFYFSQQVSHHPPISAIYCRSQHFQYLSNSLSQLSFTGKSLKLIPSSSSSILLHSQNDKYNFNKCTISINNILFGNLYIQISGEIQIICEMYKTKAKIVFNQKSWRKQQKEIDGIIFKDGRQQAKIYGYWNKEVKIKDIQGKQKVIWVKKHKEINDQYNFNHYAIQMNHLSLNLIKEIPPTDSRFRPDQRILQYRDVQLSNKEKLRLEEKQRKRRKQNQLLQKVHQPTWFKVTKNGDQNVFEFLNDKYQNQRFKDDKWTECMDIFN